MTRTASVTAVLASYRGYDTMGEVTVIFTAGVAVLLLLSGLRHSNDELEVPGIHAQYLWIL